jgi:hypothetical protein
VLKAWLVERVGAAEEPLFVSNRGARLSRDAVERMVRAHVTTASKTCRSLRTKRVTPHVLRHSAAMQLLQNGVDRTVNALWLGHESVETTQMYIHADMQIKEKAMARTRPVDEVALDALAIAYEARSRFEGIRSRFVQEHEYEGIDHVEVGNVQYQVGHREAQRSPYAVLKRLKNNSDCFDKVSDIEPKFMAIFGAETQAYFELLYEATTIVRVSANPLFEDAVIEHDPSDQVTRERLRKLRMDVFASKGKFEDEDRVGQKLLEFQARIEELCRPIVDATFGRRKGRKKH